MIGRNNNFSTLNKNINKKYILPNLNNKNFSKLSNKNRINKVKTRNAKKLKRFKKKTDLNKKDKQRIKFNKLYIPNTE